ncbi:hypothetical protein BU26DRAFT_582734 [Trematosphaeria pertusa]|uniref:Uncharacterized protein n=1 Tax=Trematosphaeria pertusa TaxID=390896 RepID=A0A6A6IV60_9PLEO|nr:uncharacterized protein BU26DRAFT_582734 [Trematosphaeria pertusa]KAF2254276.1 hypothetical protein BU26DRAFT_582734 [Trematosphaeria pertusa]
MLHRAKTQLWMLESLAAFKLLVISVRPTLKEICQCTATWLHPITALRGFPAPAILMFALNLSALGSGPMQCRACPDGIFPPRLNPTAVVNETRSRLPSDANDACYFHRYASRRAPHAAETDTDASVGIMWRGP